MPVLFLIWLFLFLYVEVALVIEAGNRVGAPGVIAAFLASAALGLFVMRRQGLRAFRSLQQAFVSGADPLADISNGFLVLLAGFLLFVPGFLTDALGLLLLVPQVRTFLIRRGTVRRARGHPPAETGTRKRTGSDA